VRRPQAFSASRRFAPPVAPPALFRAGGAHGVPPFRGFPFSSVASSLDDAAPRDVSVDPRVATQALALELDGICPQTATHFRRSRLRRTAHTTREHVCREFNLTRSPFVRPVGVTYHAGVVPLLGFQPSRVFPFVATTRPLPCLLSCTSPKNVPGQVLRWCSRVSVSNEIGWTLSSLPTLLGFCASSPFRPNPNDLQQ